MKKIFKMTLLLGTITPLIASTGIVLASCSSHEEKPKPTMNWTDFKKAALKATALQIVNATKPINWNKPNDKQLLRFNVKTVDEDQTITLDITFNVSGLRPKIATFRIVYTINLIYNINLWSIFSGPDYADTWAVFKHQALSVTPAQILKVASIKAFANKIGWEDYTSVPNFDTAGYRAGGFIGMQGEPTVYKSTNTIKAIISMTRDDGSAADFNVLPIAVSATYNPNHPSSYDVSSSWVNPIELTQLTDSRLYVDRVASIIDKIQKSGDSILSIDAIYDILSKQYPTYKSKSVHIDKVTPNYNNDNLEIRATMTNTTNRETKKITIVAQQQHINKKDFYGDGYNEADNWEIGADI